LDAAADAYGVNHVIFCFPHDLTGEREIEFEQRLDRRRDGVSAEWWGMTEMHAQAEATPDGRRAVQWAFGPSTEEEREAIFQAAAAGGELDGVDDVLGRLRELGRWLSRRDEYFAYTTHGWEAGQPEPAIPSGTVMSVLEVDDDVRERVDAVSRYPEEDGAPPVGGRIIFAPDEAGRRAYDAFREATRDGRPLRLEEGVSWAFESLPSLFSDDLDEVEPIAIVIEPLPSDPPATMHASLTVDDKGPRETLDLDLEGLASPPASRELAWRGEVPGLALTLTLRHHREGGGETLVDATSRLSETAPIRGQLRALRFMRALHAKGELLIVDRSQPQHRLAIPLSDRGPDEQLDGLIALLDALVLIENWSGERLTLPAEIAPEEAKGILGLAAGLRVGGWPIEVGDIYLPAHKAPPEESAYFVQQEVGYRVFGRELWLGVMTFQVPDVEMVESSVLGKVVARSRHGSPVRVHGVLRPGTLSSVAPPEHFESLPAEHAAPDSALAEEVRRVAADPDDSRERRAVMADMDAVTSDWPE